MSENISVTIPSLGVESEALHRTLKSLENQRRADFKTFLILPSFRPPEVIERIHSLLEGLDLDVGVEFQTGEGYEDAVNRSLQLSSDVNCLTDDDAELPPSYVGDCARILSEERLGIVGGLVNSKLPFWNRSLLFSVFEGIQPMNLLGTHRLPGYLFCFDAAGVLSLNLRVIQTSIRRNLPTLNPMGVSLAWKREAIEGFSLPCVSKRGILNESYLSLHSALAGYPVAISKQLNVIHWSHDSLSRSFHPTAQREKIREFFLSPAILNCWGLVSREKFALSKRLFLAMPLPTWAAQTVREVASFVEQSIDSDWDINELRQSYRRVFGDKPCS
jgi:hypothetical protein